MHLPSIPLVSSCYYLLKRPRVPFRTAAAPYRCSCPISGPSRLQHLGLPCRAEGPEGRPRQWTIPVTNEDHFAPCVPRIGAIMTTKLLPRCIVRSVAIKR